MIATQNNTKYSFIPLDKIDRSFWYALEQHLPFVENSRILGLNDYWRYEIDDECEGEFTQEYIKKIICEYLCEINLPLEINYFLNKVYNPAEEKLLQSLYDHGFTFYAKIFLESDNENNINSIQYSFREPGYFEFDYYQPNQKELDRIIQFLKNMGFWSNKKEIEYTFADQKTKYSLLQKYGRETAEILNKDYQYLLDIIKEKLIQLAKSGIQTGVKAVFDVLEQYKID
jgi:hypothetical protein